MSSYANQKKYHINKKIEEGDVFAMLSWEQYIQASKELTPSGLKLYMYLAKNQDGYTFYFSSKDYCETFGVTDKTYRNARMELFTHGYLCEGDNNNVYFSSAGAYKETKEKLQEELKRLGEQLTIKDIKSSNKLKEEMAAAGLKDIKDEAEYKKKIKELIVFAEEMLRDISDSEMSGLL